jgi:hypothetical protein
MRFPDTIPMPGPDEIITGHYSNNGKCCLAGWCSRAFENNAASLKFRGILFDEARKLNPVARSVEHFNDILSTPCTRALVWERAAKRLGYKVENKPWRAKR